MEHGAKSHFDINYELYFSSTGRLTGNCMWDQSELAGSLSGAKLTWTESHPWGTISFAGTYKLEEEVPRIKGKFTASDGGKGTLELTMSGS